MASRQLRPPSIVAQRQRTFMRMMHRDLASTSRALNGRTRTATLMLSADIATYRRFPERAGLAEAGVIELTSALRQTVTFLLRVKI